MKEYPFAIEMPLADRTLKEIIMAEHLATEPLDVVRRRRVFVGSRLEWWRG
jgi:hypothetical protein